MTTQAAGGRKVSLWFQGELEIVELTWTPSGGKEENVEANERDLG